MTFVFKVLRNGLLRDILYTCPNLWWRSCPKCYGMDCFGTYFTHVQTCDDVRVQCYGMDCFGAYFTLHILYTCPNPWWRSCPKCYGMDCFGTYFTHVQTCDDVRVQSATEWTASVHTLHMSKPVMTFVLKVLRNGLLRDILYACPNLCWRSCPKCYGMDCFGIYFTHVQNRDDIRVQSATEWTASVHTLHMSKPVMTFVSEVLRNGLLRCILYTTYTLHMSKPVMTFVSKVLRNGMLRYILYTCPNLWWRSCSKCYGMDCFGAYFTLHILYTCPNLWWRSCPKCYGMDCFGTYFTHVQTCDDVRVQSATEWTASTWCTDASLGTFLIFPRSIPALCSQPTPSRRQLTLHQLVEQAHDSMIFALQQVPSQDIIHHTPWIVLEHTRTLISTRLVNPVGLPNTCWRRPSTSMWLLFV